MSFSSPQRSHKNARAQTPFKNPIHHTVLALEGIVFTVAGLLFSLCINDGKMDPDGADSLSGRQKGGLCSGQEKFISV